MGRVCLLSRSAVLMMLSCEIAGRYSVIIVPDMAERSAFDVAVRDCSGIIHVASATMPSPDPNEVIVPSIAGAINALESATKEASIKRFVLAGSVAAAVSQDRGVRNEISSTDWNMLDFDDAWAPPPYDYSRVAAVAASSKMQTEAGVWRWFKKNKPYFALNTGQLPLSSSIDLILTPYPIVLPDTLFGPTLDPTAPLPPSTALLKLLHQNRNFSCPPSHAVDVTDAALLHVAALMLRDVTQQRIFAASTPWNVQSLAQLLQGLYPKKQIGTNVPQCETDLTVFAEKVKGEELLRRMGRKGWTGLETSVQRAMGGVV